MAHRLFIVEGLPCSGKSTASAFIARLLEAKGNVCFVDEGTGNHPADYEWHALAPAGPFSPESQVVPLSAYSGELLKRLLPYKIYDALPWETEKPLMLDKWRRFAADAKNDVAYVFNCVFLQNPMCETMMRFDFPEEESRAYVESIARIIEPMNPVIVYLKNDDIADSVLSAAQQRPGWLDTVIDYHANGAFGKRIGAEGFDGYIRCLEERQKRELRMLSDIPIECLVLENPQRNWIRAQEYIRRYIDRLMD